jgi:hypothetical protein
MTTQARIERLSARLEHITAELDKRDFSDVPTAKLVELELKTRAELAKEFFENSIRSIEELRGAKAARTSNALAVWSPGGDTTLLLEPEESGNGRKRSRQAD